MQDSAHKTDCVFCKIVSGEIEAKKIYEDDDFIVIPDKFPTAPIHLLVIPKRHYSKLNTLQEDMGDFWSRVFAVANKVVKQENLWPNFKYLVNGPAFAHFNHEHLHIQAGFKS